MCKKLKPLAALGLLGALVLPRAALADMSFHVTEVVAEDEIRPRQAHHTVRWEGDYEVSEAGVSVLGFGRKDGGATIPYDRPEVARDIAGSSFTRTIHRVADGIEVTIEYGTFVLTRRLVQTGPQACSDTIAAVLKPGQAFFEVHRLSNHELMVETRRDYVFVRCEVPKLLS